ncbi:MAG: hypothetical protein LIO85_01825, partial [Rikenellaceae bacterium]|nr:hypothetical protein [Rikenellaceae bacterium]
MTTRSKIMMGPDGTGLIDFVLTLGRFNARISAPRGRGNGLGEPWRCRGGGRGAGPPGEAVAVA